MDSQSTDFRVPPVSLPQSSVDEHAGTGREVGSGDLAYSVPEHDVEEAGAAVSLSASRSVVTSPVRVLRLTGSAERNVGQLGILHVPAGASPCFVKRPPSLPLREARPLPVSRRRSHNPSGTTDGLSLEGSRLD